VYHIVIPARFGSTRLPGKALADIHGKPMIWWVWNRACQSSAASVIVATDHPEIATIMQSAGAQVAMTRDDHPSGTDRLAEVADQQQWNDDTVVVNLQGDEPMMPVVNLEQVALELARHPVASVATLSEPIATLDDFSNPAVVKVVATAEGNASYFSRAMIPFPRGGAEEHATELLHSARRHVGLYAYRCGFLREFVAWPPAPTEKLESLEQLRALYHDRVIRVQPALESVPVGVDTFEDLELVRRLMAGAANAT